jgi:hypothetical protein
VTIGDRTHIPYEPFAVPPKTVNGRHLPALRGAARPFMFQHRKSIIRRVREVQIIRLGHPWGRRARSSIRRCRAKFSQLQSVVQRVG